MNLGLAERKRIRIISIILLAMIVGIIVLWRLEILSTTIKYLDSEKFQFQVGKAHLSAFDILKALFLLVLMLWVTGRISYMVDKTLRRSRHIGASNRALVVKITTIILYFVSFLTALGAVGIDFTTLKIFGGALGIGIGFGLQKIASNFISGIILLFEKTINEGDLIELNKGEKGVVRKSGARYTLMDAGDGREILIPNEDLITSRVTNWTYSTIMSRVEINLKLSLETDPNKAQEIISGVINAHKKCSKIKAPDCFLINMANGSMDFQAHMWIDNYADAGAVTHELLISTWEKLKENKIELYHPARDVYMQTPIKFEMKTEEK